MENSLKQKILSGVLWQSIERFSGEIIQFIISVILARLLEPKEFGAIAIFLVFIKVFEVFIDGGFRSAIVQRKNLTDAECDTVFWINITVGICCYVILFFAAPFFSKFYQMESLTGALRILGMILIIHSTSLTAGALLQKQMLFKQNFIIQSSAITISSLVGVILAYGGFGLWALIWQRISHAVIVAVILYIFLPWRPQLRFQKKAAWELFRYGSNLLLAGILNVLQTNFYTMIIGKLFSPAILAYYNRGYSYPNLASQTINSTIGQVMFPVFSKTQEDQQKLADLLKKSLQITSFFTTPLLLFLLVASRPLVTLILTEKWLPSVPFMQIFALTFLFYPTHILNLQICRATGNSNYFLYLEIIKKILILLAALCLYSFGAIALAWGTVAVSLLSGILHSFVSSILINFGFWKQIKALLPFWLSGLIASLVCHLASFASYRPILELFILGIIFFSVYLLIGMILYRNFLLSAINEFSLFYKKI